MQTFSERLRDRQQRWWGDVGGREGLHRLVELVARRHRDDDDASWRCCPRWQRRLLNKWNGREFAARHGLRVPALYWFGRRTAAIPLAALPAHFVVRPVHGAAGRGVHVVAGDRELLSDAVVPRAALAAALRRSLGRVARWPLLVEEFARGEDGGWGLPTEYKCYAFAGEIAVIQVLQRTGRREARQRCYTPDWTPIEDPFQTDYELAPPGDPPRCLAEMLRGAAALGAACDTFMRVDCFATPDGCVFDEFSSTPYRAMGFTPYADEWLGERWQRLLPDRG